MYHYGITIKEYRERKNMTQQQLADVWPKSERFGGGEGVNWKYVQDIEHGRKRIEDHQTLRKVCAILDIPSWKVGLSEYDPFTAQTLPGRGKTMYDQTLDVVESLVRQLWSLRCAARIPEAERGVTRLGEIFAYFQKDLPPPPWLERRYHLLYVQYLRLKATAFLEKKLYKETMALYRDMYELVKNANEPAMKALALKSIGKELERTGHSQEAVAYLEEARDAALHTSKLLMAFVHSYLIRVYASNGDSMRFERAVDTGLTIARSLPGTYEDGTDFVYSWSPVSAIMAEQSWGYIELGQPEKTLAMRGEIAHALEIGQDARVQAWIPLDYAKAYRLIGEVEKCIDELREFNRRCTIMGFPHAMSQVQKELAKLDKDGYADVQVVKDFREEIHEETDTQSV